MPSSELHEFVCPAGFLYPQWPYLVFIYDFEEHPETWSRVKRTTLSEINIPCRFVVLRWVGRDTPEYAEQPEFEHLVGIDLSERFILALILR